MDPRTNRRQSCLWLKAIRGPETAPDTSYGMRPRSWAVCVAVVVVIVVQERGEIWGGIDGNGREDSWELLNIGRD